MIEEQIEAQVRDHYSDADAKVLLLSQLGKKLKDEGHWPPQNDSRTLTEIVEETAGVSLVRDENAKAFIAIVLAGSEQIANDAIEERHKRIFLRDVSRALLAAFTIEVDPKKNVYVHLKPKLKFSVDAQEVPDAILVDAKLRTPGLDVSDIRDLALDDVTRLDSNIRTWCNRHDVDFRAITWKQERPDTLAETEDSQASNGLERLYAVQDPGLAKRLVIPFDIAIELSRMK